MPRFVFVRFVVPAALIAACSATAPLPEQPAAGGSGGQTGGGRAGSSGTSAKNGGASGVGGAGGGTTAGAAGEGGGGEAATGGTSAGKAGAAGKAPVGGTGGAAGKGQSGSAGEKNEAGAAGSPTSGGAAGAVDPFGGGGSDNGGSGGAESCDLVKVAPGDGLSCTSVNYITTGDVCLGCDRGPSLYFCEGTSAPPSPGCSTLPSYGAGYFCCDKSVCTPQPGGCDGAQRFHCAPDATVPSACKKLGGDPTSYCCPK